MEKQAPRNTADEEKVREGSKRAKEIRRQELDDIRFVLSDVRGRRFMWRLVNQICHYDADDANHSGSFTYLSLGQRTIGKAVKDDIYQADISAWHEMERKHIEEMKGYEND